MTGTEPPSPFTTVAAELAALGVTIAVRPGEYCVNIRGGMEAMAYFTDDLEDAFEHGRAMTTAAVARSQSAVEHPRRKWRRPMSARAARRAFIKKHNRRTRARALRERRTEG